MPSRVLSEPEFDAIKAKVLAAAPDGLDEVNFNRWAGPRMAAAIAEAENMPAPVEGSAVGRFVGGAAEVLNPVPIVKALWNAAPIPQALGGSGVVEGPTQFVKGVVGSQMAQGAQAIQAAREGRAVEALGHGAAAVIPILGPAAAQAGEQIAAGDVAGGLGKGAGLLAPVAVAEGARAVGRASGLVPPTTREIVAARLAKIGAEKVTDVMVPKVGANKVRLGNMAQKVAPELAQDLVKEGAPLSREGFHAQVGAKLADAEQALDAASDARLNARTFPTQPIIQDLMAKRRALMAEPVEASRPVPSVTEGVVREVPVDPMRTYALKWIKDDMENIPFVKRTWTDLSGETGLKGNAAGGHMQITAGAAGAPIYDQIISEAGMRPTRAAVTKAVQEVIDGNTEGRLRQAIVKVADDLAKGDKQTKKAMTTSGPIPAESDYATVKARDISGKGAPPELAKEGRPIGEAVAPAPHADRIAAIDQAIAEVKQLGPAARYESLRRIRQAWDQPARVKYNPSLTQDFLKNQGYANGAADVTGTLRDALAKFDPETAKANAQYSLYRKADDVLTATAEIERVRPKVGRQIMARFTGAVTGEAAAGPLGAAVGVLLGPVVDGALSSGLTMQLQTARLLTKLSNAIQRGDLGAVTSATYELKKLAKRTGAIAMGTTNPSESQSQTTAPASGARP